MTKTFDDHAFDKAIEIMTAVHKAAPNTPENRGVGGRIECPACKGQLRWAREARKGRLRYSCAGCGAKGIE